MFDRFIRFGYCASKLLKLLTRLLQSQENPFYPQVFTLNFIYWVFFACRQADRSRARFVVRRNPSLRGQTVLFFVSPTKDPYCLSPVSVRRRLGQKKKIKIINPAGKRTTATTVCRTDGAINKTRCVHARSVPDSRASPSVRVARVVVRIPPNAFASSTASNTNTRACRLFARVHRYRHVVRRAPPPSPQAVRLAVFLVAVHRRCRRVRHRRLAPRQNGRLARPQRRATVLQRGPASRRRQVRAVAGAPACSGRLDRDRGPVDLPENMLVSLARMSAVRTSRVLFVHFLTCVCARAGTDYGRGHAKSATHVVLGSVRVNGTR